MNINDLQTKVTSATDKVNKIENTIEKHRKGKEKKKAILQKLIEQYNINVNLNEITEKDSRWYFSYRDKPFYNELCWAISDVEDKEQSIKESIKKLEEAKKVLKNWTEKLRNEQVKMQYIQDSIPQVIKDFLLNWKNSIIKYMYELKEQYIVDFAEYKEEINKIYYEYISSHKDKFSYLNIEDYDSSIDYRREITSWSAIKEIKSDSRYIHIEDQFNYKYHDALFENYLSKRWDNEWLDKILEEEMNNRLIELITKVSKITGEIVDADLYIEKGDLNGIVTGKDGKAKVNTIGAGGYHIQRFHYRVLVKKV